MWCGILIDKLSNTHIYFMYLQWRHNERDGVSNHRRLDCFLNHLFRRRSNKTSKLRVISLCERDSPVTGKFPAQRASYAENVSIWWRHHAERANQYLAINSDWLARINQDDILVISWWYIAWWRISASTYYVIIGSDNGLSLVRYHAIVD